jgi:hypothetical protein
MGYTRTTTKQFIPDKNVEQAFQAWIAAVNAMAKAYTTGSALAGGSALDLKSLKDYKEIFKRLIKEGKIEVDNPLMLVAGTIMEIRADQFSSQADALANILSDYHATHSADGTVGGGIYIVTQTSFVGTMGGTGSLESNSFYDAVSNKLIGSTNEHY